MIEKPDHTLATAFDACEICGTQGYYRKGPEVICRNCGSEIVISTIGTEAAAIRFRSKSHVDGGTLVINIDALERDPRFLKRVGPQQPSSSSLRKRLAGAELPNAA